MGQNPCCDYSLATRSLRLPLRALVAAEHPKEISDLTQVCQRLLAAFFPDIADEVHVEEVFPGPATQGTRLELRQVDIPQRENTEAFVERSGSVARRKDD